MKKLRTVLGFTSFSGAHREKRAELQPFIRQRGCSARIAIDPAERVRDERTIRPQRVHRLDDLPAKRDDIFDDEPPPARDFAALGVATRAVRFGLFADEERGEARRLRPYRRDRDAAHFEARERVDS